MHALGHEAEPCRDVPGVVLHPGDLTRVDEVRALLLDLAPDEVYNLAAISSVAQSWAEPDLTARVNGLAAAALMESARQVQERRPRVRFVQASSAEIFGEPETSPQDESTPIRPVNPYGAAKAYAHLMVDVHRRRGLHAVSAILYNHESPRRPERFVTRKITATVAAIAQGRADRLSSATSTPAATGAGRPTTSTRWSAPPAPTSRATTSSPPASGTPSATSSARPSAGPASTTGRRSSTHRPRAGPAGRPDRSHRRRHPRAGAARLGADGRVRRAGRTDGRRRSQARGRGTLSTPDDPAGSSIRRQRSASASLTISESPEVGKASMSLSATLGTGTWETSWCRGRMCRGSRSPKSSSWSFSPSRRPVYSIWHRLTGLLDQLAGDVQDPHRLAHLEHQRLARRPIAAAWMTSWQASSMVMK